MASDVFDLDLRRVEEVRGFLMEDMGYGDITSEALIPEDREARGHLYFREAGVIAGLEEAEIIFRLLGCRVSRRVSDGDLVEAGETLLSVEGPARAILAGERTVLNVVGRMAGIATSSRQVQERASAVNPGVRVAATRKTAPGLRELDKRAVALGGADTHRFRLDDCVLIKDNHLALTPSISGAVRRARERVSFTKKIEVEVRSREEALEAAKAGADIVMFDNMEPTEIVNCLRYLGEEGERDGVLFEASGGITPDNIGEYAATGVDVISMGWLTHSVTNMDVKLEIEMI